MSESLQLPDADRAVIPVEKLRSYALDPTHRYGRHKARVFAAVLGIGQDDWAYLRDAILEALSTAYVSAVRESLDGLIYEVRVDVDGLNGRSAEVLTAWETRFPGDAPRLVTAYINRPGRECR